jgi:hypothetical protein
MSKERGAISEKMDLGTYEKLLVLARKYNVSSFSVGEVTVNLGDTFKDLPTPESNPGAAMDEDTDDGMEPMEGHNLLHSPLLG